MNIWFTLWAQSLCLLFSVGQVTDFPVVTSKVGKSVKSGQSTDLTLTWLSHGHWLRQVWMQPLQHSCWITSGAQILMNYIKTQHGKGPKGVAESRHTVTESHATDLLTSGVRSVTYQHWCQALTLVMMLGMILSWVFHWRFLISTGHAFCNMSDPHNRSK